MLRGDLVVVGSGDPTINGRGGSPTRVFESWADQLLAAGHPPDRRAHRRRRACLRPGEPRCRAGRGTTSGHGYAAPVSALQFNEDVATLVIRPGLAAGAPARVEVRPAESGLLVDERRDAPPAGSADVELRAPAGVEPRDRRPARVPVGSKEITRSVAVDDPALYFVARPARRRCSAEGHRRCRATRSGSTRRPGASGSAAAGAGRAPCRRRCPRSRAC